MELMPVLEKIHMHNAIGEIVPKIGAKGQHDLLSTAGVNRPLVPTPNKRLLQR